MAQTALPVLAGAFEKLRLLLQLQMIFLPFVALVAMGQSVDNWEQEIKLAGRDPQALRELSRRVLEFSRTNPEVAIVVCEKFPDGEPRGEIDAITTLKIDLLRDVAIEWWKKSPSAALAWADASFSRIGVLRSIVSQWALSAPDEAARWIKTWDEKHKESPAHNRGELIGTVVPPLAKVDAQFAINLARKIEDQYSRDRAFISIIEEVSLINPGGAYSLTKEISTNASTQLQQNLPWSKWGAGTAKTAAAAATVWVHRWSTVGFPGTPNGRVDQDQAPKRIGSFCGRWSMFDLAKATAWGRAIPPPYSQACLAEIHEASTCAPLSKRLLEQMFPTFQKGEGWLRDRQGWLCFTGGFGEYRFGEEGESFCARVNPSDKLREIRISTHRDQDSSSSGPAWTLAVLVDRIVPDHRRGQLLKSGDGSAVGNCQTARLEQYKCVSVATREMCHGSVPTSVTINWKR